MIKLRETTEFTEVDYDVPKHDYLLLDTTRVVGFRRQGEDKWQKFSRPLNFSKKGRSFQTLNEEDPTEYSYPNWIDPWENTSYNSLEAFMA
jgi:hypothetical protein